MRLSSQLAQSHFSVLHGVPLSSERSITKARAAIFTLWAITTLKAASTLIAKTTFVRTRCAFAISAIARPTATYRSWYRLLLAGSIIAAHGHQRASGFRDFNRLDGLGGFNRGRISFNGIGLRFP
jgi:hypothetical protein